MKPLFLSLLIYSSLLGGCVLAPPTPPTASELESADYGAPIDQNTAESIAKAETGRRLKDPSSAQYEFKPVRKGYDISSPVHGTKTVFGYILDGSLNGKNSYGGYTGFKPFRLVFVNQKLVTVWMQVTDKYGTRLEQRYGNYEGI